MADSNTNYQEEQEAVNGDIDNEYERMSGEDLQNLSTETRERKILNLGFDISTLMSSMNQILEIRNELGLKYDLKEEELAQLKSKRKELKDQRDSETEGSPFDK